MYLDFGIVSVRSVILETSRETCVNVIRASLTIFFHGHGASGPRIPCSSTPNSGFEIGIGCPISNGLLIDCKDRTTIDARASMISDSNRGCIVRL